MQRNTAAVLGLSVILAGAALQRSTAVTENTGHVARDTLRRIIDDGHDVEENEGLRQTVATLQKQSLEQADALARQKTSTELAKVQREMVTKEQTSLRSKLASLDAKADAQRTAEVAKLQATAQTQMLEDEQQAAQVQRSVRQQLNASLKTVQQQNVTIAKDATTQASLTNELAETQRQLSEAQREVSEAQKTVAEQLGRIAASTSENQRLRDQHDINAKSSADLQAKFEKETRAFAELKANATRDAGTVKPAWLTWR